MAAQGGLHEVIRGDGGPFTVNPEESSLVDQFANRFQVGGTPSNVRLTDSKHVDSSLVQLDENTVVNLSKPEQLENLANLGSNLVDTADTHDEGQLRLGWHIKVSTLLGLTGEP